MTPLLQTLLFGYPKLNHNQNCIYLMPCSTLLSYQNALTDPLMRCPIALYPSTFDCPSPPSPATQQASRAHDKRDLYNTCIVSQLSRNKYCLNQHSCCNINTQYMYRKSTGKVGLLKAALNDSDSVKEVHLVDTRRIRRESAG